MSAVAATVLLLLNSCSQEEGLPHALEVSAEIAGNGVTRTTESTVGASDYDKLTFDATDEILITKNSEAAVTYANKGTNSWSSKNGTPITTTGSGDTFRATYPVAFGGILQEQNTYAGFWKSKQLSSTGTVSGNKVSFIFKPVAAKISVSVSYDNAQAPATATLSMSGTGIRGGSGTETINMLRTSVSTDKKRYSFAGIIAPGSRTYTFTFYGDVAGTKTYAQATALNLQAGYNYLYTFTSTNELILTGVTVTPFGDPVEEDSGTAT